MTLLVRPVNPENSLWISLEKQDAVSPSASPIN